MRGRVQTTVSTVTPYTYRIQHNGEHNVHKEIKSDDEETNEVDTVPLGALVRCNSDNMVRGARAGTGILHLVT